MILKKNNFSLTAVFFDLDGTLLDTAPDLATALNQLLCKYGRSPLPLEIIRPAVAGGSSTILGHGFQITTQDPLFPTLRAEFLTAYQQCLHEQTQFFPGIEAVLSYLDQQKIPWGIVTNKPGWLANPLLSHFKLNHRYCCLVAGDSLPQRKPNPEPLWHACHIAKVSPETSIYIGDTEHDVRAAKAAGMLAMIATYGYLAPHDQPENWQADILINTPGEILQWFKER